VLHHGSIAAAMRVAPQVLGVLVLSIVAHSKLPALVPDHTDEQRGLWAAKLISTKPPAVASTDAAAPYVRPVKSEPMSTDEMRPALGARKKVAQNGKKTGLYLVPNAAKESREHPVARATAKAKAGPKATQHGIDCEVW
jgi:hypothetical protein